MYRRNKKSGLTSNSQGSRNPELSSECGGLLAQHLGLPIPGPLFLLAAAALAATGKMEIAAALVLAVGACVTGDWAWYEAGRRNGDRVLDFIHRLTRDPITQ